jgi:hypothetical protein
MPKCVTLGCPSTFCEEKKWNSEVVYRIHITKQGYSKEQVSSTKDC